MVERLQAVGMRSVNNIVDITNYVMMEYSQPLHSFDYNRLEGRRIVVRPAAQGEQLVAIDGTKCPLTGENLVIADAARPVAIAGVMGGQNTEVTERTRNVLLEAAIFDPLSIRSHVAKAAAAKREQLPFRARRRPRRRGTGQPAGLQAAHPPVGRRRIGRRQR